MLIEFGPPPAPWWKDLLLALPSVVTASAAVAGLVIAWRGLNTWRRETIGRRRADLAEQVLAQFYEARDVLSWVRSPIAIDSESEDRPGREAESENVRRRRDMYYPVISRMGSRSELFANLRAHRYRIIALFGTQAAEPIHNLGLIHTQIGMAAQRLMRYKTHENARLAADLESVIWEDTDGDDVVLRNINKIVENVEDLFRPEITRGLSR